jgi:hypothetical protein
MYNENVISQHMKTRCYFMSVMCGVSLYTWTNYSLFDPVNNDFFSPHYQNCLLFLFYLSWDLYKMYTNKLLYRTDLVIHHIVSISSCALTFNSYSLQMSNMLIAESISVMNYVWSNEPELLKLWRTACVLLCRMPIELFLIFGHNPTFNAFGWTTNNTPFAICFILYDCHILWKLYK